ncbi:hypotheticla protein [Erwinia phage vB_EamP-S2]|uniref:Hypotheticla protein n=1 Tax=Erwinia phage vB_EamP-S2 TaxID=2070198 RepID=A0A2K9V4Y2_9CAUD|nr:hypotheticla protein [Erwinia phage vB_EamP-S2]AUV57224.1 hypotheticla protein [Erwinia phage vB_EamP-S2]
MLIILNGPPGVGKDTLALAMEQVISIKALSFKGPMWEIAESLLGKLKFEEFCELYHDRETKELPQAWLAGLSPRQFFIHISENIAKPMFGDQYFGLRLKEEYDDVIMSGDSMAVVSDGGFSTELFPFLNAHEEVLVVRLYREGFSFGGDSRNYLNEGQFAFFPQHTRPEFMDVHLVEGQPGIAMDAILKRVME